MLTFVFPGQGSQMKGMGRTFFEEFRELTSRADAILGYSIKELCLEDPDLKLGLTQYTQPALYIVNAFSYLKKINETGRKPNFVAGHSLGEYNALLAAGVFDFETGLKLVQKRGELMSRATGGGMAAIIGLTEEQIAAVLKQNRMERIDIANLNSPFQIVISGPKTDIDLAQPIFEAMQEVKLFTLLKTSGAFHSRYMAEAGKEFEMFLNTFELQPLTIPVISNVHARPYPSSNLKQNLIDQMTHPVKWTESIRYLMGLGEMEFEEIGSGKVLTGLIQRIRKEAEPLIIQEVAPVSSTTPEEKIKPSPTVLNEETKETIDTKQISEAKETGNNVFLEAKPENLQFAGPDEVKESKKTGNPGAAFGKALTGAFKNVQEKAKALVPSALGAETHQRGKQGLGSRKTRSDTLGSDEFKKEYNVKYTYVAGGMERGITNQEFVLKMAKAGILSFLGTTGLELAQIEKSLQYLRNELKANQPYGVNVSLHSFDPEVGEKAERVIDLLLQYQVNNIEISCFSIPPALIKYRIKGIGIDSSGYVLSKNRILAKVSRPEMAEEFLRPPDLEIVNKLLSGGEITKEEAELSKGIPVANDICVISDSAGTTDKIIPGYSLLPAILNIRDRLMNQYKYYPIVRIGYGGGIGTPQAAASAFMLGADFILTGSVNQCSIEAAISDEVKDLLSKISVQDTEYVPACDMLEMGLKRQVMKKGVLFSIRANKLYDLYRQYESLDEIEPSIKKQLQEKYFLRSFDEIYCECQLMFSKRQIEKAEQNPKYKMLLVFKWYLIHSAESAIKGESSNKVNYQVYSSPALGAFNEWAKGIELEDWRNRHVDQIGILLMDEAGKFLNTQMKKL